MVLRFAKMVLQRVTVTDYEVIVTPFVCGTPRSTLSGSNAGERKPASMFIKPGQAKRIVFGVHSCRFNGGKSWPKLAIDAEGP